MAEAKKKIHKDSEKPKKRTVPKKKKEAADHAPIVEKSKAAAKAKEVSEFRPKAEAPFLAAERKPRKHKIVGSKYYGTGRRKEAVAKVWIAPGGGNITVNGRPMAQFFCGRKLLELFVTRPFSTTQTAGKYDVFAQTIGGGVSSQAGAVGLGIARALVELNPEYKTLLKRQGLLTRDPRMKERKKYGLKRARRAFQFTKR